MVLLEKLLIDIIVAGVFGSIFILICYLVYKKTEKRESRLAKEKLKEQEIEIEQIRAEHEKIFAEFGGSYTEQDIRIKQLQKDNDQQILKTEHLQEKYDKELHFRKSSEVRLGKIGENLAPFLNGWPWVPRQFRFLGNPVDGIQFNDDEIIFVEIKTGKARLSKGQKNTKELIKAGKVSFVTFKITDDGINLIKED